jgi:hypothetical protein
MKSGILFKCVAASAGILVLGAAPAIAAHVTHKKLAATVKHPHALVATATPFGAKAKTVHTAAITHKTAITHKAKTLTAAHKAKTLAVTHKAKTLVKTAAHKPKVTTAAKHKVATLDKTHHVTSNT